MPRLRGGVGEERAMPQSSRSSENLAKLYVHEADYRQPASAKPDRHPHQWCSSLPDVTRPAP